MNDARKLRASLSNDSTEKSLEQTTEEVELFLARQIAYCVLDKDLQPIFTPEQVLEFDVDAYNALSMETLAFNKLNVDLETLKDELKKVQA